MGIAFKLNIKLGLDCEWMVLYMYLDTFYDKKSCNQIKIGILDGIILLILFI